MAKELYTIQFSSQAKKDFLKLDKKVQFRIKSVLMRIRVRPFSFVKKLVGSTAYRLRVGEYRIILDITQKTLTILVIKIKHRKNVYKDI